MSLSDVGTNLGKGPFSIDIAINNFHPTERTHWVAYNNKNYFVSYGCSPPQKISRFVIKRNGHCFYSEYKIQSPRSRFFLCSLLFTYNLFDKICRNKFYICWFKVVLSHNFLGSKWRYGKKQLMIAVDTSAKTTNRIASNLHLFQKRYDPPSLNPAWERNLCEIWAIVFFATNLF